MTQKPVESSFLTVKILNIGTCMSEQTVKILIRLLLRSSLIRIYTVCHSLYIYWRHYFIVKSNGFILRTTAVAGLGVPIFRVFTVYVSGSSVASESYLWSQNQFSGDLHGRFGQIFAQSCVSKKIDFYRKNSKIWDTSNNCHNCPKNRKV